MKEKREITVAWELCVWFRVFHFLDDGDRANQPRLNNQHPQSLRLAAVRLAMPKYSGLDFPPCLYNPLRPQTTIAIDQVNTTKSDTQPSVKIAIVPLLK